MTKLEFMFQLREKLSRLPDRERQDRMDFYCEMIEDRVEEGLSEEEAVAEIASRMESELMSETDQPPKIESAPSYESEKIPQGKERRLDGWVLALILIGFPIWLSLAVAAVAVVLSLYAVLWATVISVWAVFVSFAVCALAFVAAAPVLAVVGKGLVGLFAGWLGNDIRRACDIRFLWR